MASVISSQTIQDDPQADGRRWVRYRFVVEDHDFAQQDIYVGPKKVPSGFDDAADRAVIGPTILDRLAADEESGIEDMNSVADPLAYAQNPKWSTDKRIAKSALLWMMRERDPRLVVYLEPLINYLRATYTGGQLATWLEITNQYAQQMGRRIDAILTDTGTVKNQLVAFDAEADT